MTDVNLDQATWQRGKALESCRSEMPVRRDAVETITRSMRIIGGQCRVRTCDLLLVRQAL